MTRKGSGDHASPKKIRPSTKSIYEVWIQTYPIRVHGEKSLKGLKTVSEPIAIVNDKN